MTIEAMTREHITGRHYRPLPAENPVSAKDIERERIARERAGLVNRAVGLPGRPVHTSPEGAA